MRYRSWVFSLVLTMGPVGAAPGQEAGDEGPLVRSLWLVQQYGTAEAVDPAADASVKGRLARALAPEGLLNAAAMKGLMDASMFARLAGPDGKLDADEARKALEAAVPVSRTRLNPAARAHADLLTTSFDRLDGPHAEAGATLAAWIARHYRPGQPLHVTVICTGNSRRSILGAAMGNVAAAYHGLPEIRFHSGGTAPTAFDPRTIACLEAIGIEVEPTGNEAPRGDLKTANPVYTVRWGQGEGSDFESVEFSKTYFDAANPREGFAALMVCGEADASCPVVKGASARISMPYLDPKIYDGSPYEALKYAERRDDLGRLLLAVMMQARQRVAAP